MANVREAIAACLAAGWTAEPVRRRSRWSPSPPELDAAGRRQRARRRASAQGLRGCAGRRQSPCLAACRWASHRRAGAGRQGREEGNARIDPRRLRPGVGGAGSAAVESTTVELLPRDSAGKSIGTAGRRRRLRHRGHGLAFTSPRLPRIGEDARRPGETGGARCFSASSRPTSSSPTTRSTSRGQARRAGRAPDQSRRRACLHADKLAVDRGDARRPRETGSTIEGRQQARSFRACRARLVRRTIAAAADDPAACARPMAPCNRPGRLFVCETGSVWVASRPRKMGAEL